MRWTAALLGVLMLWTASLGGKAALRIHIEETKRERAIQCHIAVDENNRWLILGVENHFASTVQLSGDEHDPPIVRRPLPPIGCDGEERAVVVFCELFRTPKGLFDRKTEFVPCVPY